MSNTTISIAATMFNGNPCSPIPTSIRPRANQGFTLIELAIVLVILGMVVVGGLTAMTSRLAQQRIDSTKTRAETIKTALSTFISRNNRLPCPAIAGLNPGAAGYGQEAPTPGTCTGTTIIGVAPNSSARGIVPWISLGLASDAASDAYQNRFTYQVTLTQTNLNNTTLAGMQGNLSLHSGTPIAMGLPPTGNQINGCNTTANNNSCNGFAVVVLLSHGNNGRGATNEAGIVTAAPASPEELQNAGNNSAFVRTDYSENAANYFDDIVLAISPDDLLAPLAKDGAISSARAITQKQLIESADALIHNAVSTGINPATMTAATDGWGNALTYSRITLNICGAAAGANAFTITSNGPDRVAGLNPATGTNDDIVHTQNNDQLKSYIVKSGASCP